MKTYLPVRLGGAAAVNEQVSFRALIIAGRNKAVDELRLQLTGKGIACSVADSEKDVIGQTVEQAADVVLLETHVRSAQNREVSERIKREKPLPVIGLLGGEAINGFDIDPNIDDFIVEPYNADELVLRIKRLLKSGYGETVEVLRAGALVIDPAKCEVSVDGRVVLLTFKEYELLKFLVSNSGRVFTREALLDKVWGYDYFGGDRTVDVHIRRLRSKIEDAKHTFIETVRSIGYRFREDPRSQ